MLSQIPIYFLYSLFLITGLYFSTILVLELVFLFFSKKIKGQYISHHITENKILDGQNKQYSHFDLNIEYSYKLDNQIYKSNRKNVLDSVSRDNKYKLEEILINSIDEKKEIQVYVFRKIPEYSMIFPCKYSWKEMSLYFIFAFITPLMIYLSFQFIYS